MNRLKVAYNDSLRMVLGIPRYCSASEMLETNPARMNNEIVRSTSIVNSDLIFSSLLWLNWRQRLFYVPNS